MVVDGRCRRLHGHGGGGRHGGEGFAPTPRTDDETEPPDDEAYFLEKEFSGLYDDTNWDVIECYLNLPEAEHPENNPLSYAYIREKQQEDNALLLALLNKYPDNYVYMDLDNEEDQIICYKRNLAEDDWKIALPDTMVPEVVTWFHHVLGHPGQKGMRDTLQARYHSSKLRSEIEKLVCEECPRHKLAGKGYG